MQILIFSLLIIALIVYVIYKVKKTFTKKEITGFFTIIAIIVAGIIYANYKNGHKLPDTFKANYLEQNNIEIVKLSVKQTSFEVLSNSKEIYDFIYIINKDGKEYVCEAKDVEAQLIEDEYVFKEYKEECRKK